MDSRTVCKGRCRNCGARACIHMRGHYGPCQCAYHASSFLNRIAGMNESALRKWLVG